MCENLFLELIFYHEIDIKNPPMMGVYKGNFIVLNGKIRAGAHHAA